MTPFEEFEEECAALDAEVARLRQEADDLEAFTANLRARVAGTAQVPT